MNWKLNTWTLLFALSLATLVYLNTCGHKNSLPLPSPVSNCQPDSIPLDTAEKYMIRHTAWAGYLAQHKDTARHYQVKNPDVMLFELDSCELAEMVTYAHHGKVWAVLSVNKDSLIDLIFWDHNPKLKGTHTIRAFDFSKPCPPTCDTNELTH
ncbi:MAG: hypothetical protein IPJ82_07025 [Lewinellaceae bacterium]|nr:hypothetical protein [Lewinellaceae bacterium]